MVGAPLSVRTLLVHSSVSVKEDGSWTLMRNPVMVTFHLLVPKVDASVCFPCLALIYSKTTFPHVWIVSDVDECAENNGGCSQLCINTEGSFECSCTSGYELHTDNVTCLGEKNLKMSTSNKHIFFPARKCKSQDPRVCFCVTLMRVFSVCRL